MHPDDRRVLENHLVAQLTDVEAELAKLEAQRNTLRQLLLKVRRENVSLRDVTRKNSFDRILIENRILETLKAASKDVPTSKLYWAAQIINPQLRNSTFRSYLHRLKTKGLIAPGTDHGHWVARQGSPSQSSASVAKTA
jgi:hypothetical protein